RISGLYYPGFSVYFCIFTGHIYIIARLCISSFKDDRILFIRIFSYINIRMLGKQFTKLWFETVLPVSHPRSFPFVSPAGFFLIIISFFLLYILFFCCKFAYAHLAVVKLCIDLGNAF